MNKDLPRKIMQEATKVLLGVTVIILALQIANIIPYEVTVSTVGIEIGVIGGFFLGCVLSFRECIRAHKD